MKETEKLIVLKLTNLRETFNSLRFNFFRNFHLLGVKLYFFCAFAQLSLSETVRLNTRFSAVLSGSTLK